MAKKTNSISLSKKIGLIACFAICVFFQTLPSIRSGLLYSYGYGFWGPSGHDGIWHLSLINNIQNPLQISIPGFSGELLKNYHPFFDIFLAIVFRITRLPPSILLFQIFPIFLSLGLLCVSYYLGKKITRRILGGVLLMIFNTFATSLGWIVTLFQDGRFSGESMFWSMQSFSTLLNPPFALSLLYLLVLILILTKDTKLSSVDYLYIFIIIILSPITKAYSLISIYTIFGLYSLRKLLNKEYLPIAFFASSIVVAFVLFTHYNPSSSGLLKFQPFWIISGMFQSTDRFFVPKISSAIYNLSQSSPYDLKLIIIYLFGSIIFVVGNFGFRLLGFLVTPNQRRQNLHLDLLITVAISTLIPLAFIQQGTGWNVVQFLYYALFIGNILLVLYLSNLKPGPKTNALIIAIVVLNIIGNLDNIKSYLGNPAPASLPLSEINALQFLNQQPAGVVLTYPFESEFRKNMSTPIPLYAYETTSYISAYTHHSTYLSDEMNLQNSGYPWSLRKDNEIRFFEQKAIFEDRGFLLNNGIDYIYLTGLQINKTSLNTDKLFIKNIYNDGQTIIYQVIK